MAGFPRPYGRYVLEERIAMGGMAEIFRAHTAQAGFQKRVCIKRVLPHFLEDEEFVTMFRDEAKTAAKLQHANVVQVFDFGEVDDGNGPTLFLAMELVEGSDLRRIAEASRKKKIPFELGEVVQIGIEMCRGLHHAHSLAEGGQALGIVHRDVSPHNVLVSRAGEVKVTDFGIAKAAARATHTSTGIVKGKVAYMSPEQAEGKPFDHRLDQWAVGVVLWELLCGERLFRGENDATILRKVMDVRVPAPSSLRAVPAPLEEIILRALRGPVDERFANLRAMEQALQRFLFSGVVDPSTAEVRNVFPRILDAGADNSGPKRTAVLPTPVGIEAAALPAPKTERLEDIGSLSSTQDEKPPAASSSSSDESAVFVSASGKSAPAPRPSTPEAATVMAEDPQQLEQALSAFEKQEKKASASGKSRPSPASQAETVVVDGMLQAEANRVTAPLPEDEGTPATRTISKVQPAAPASLAVDTTLPLPKPVLPGAGEKSSRAPQAIAAGILTTGVIVALVIINSGNAPQKQPEKPPTPVVTAAPPPPPPPVPLPVPLPVPVTPPPVETAPPPPVEVKPEPKQPEKEKEKEKEKEQKPGSVYVDVPGSWANVFIGKTPMGSTPVTLQLKPGKYNLTLVNDDEKKKKTVPVTIVSGLKTKVADGW